MVFAKVPNNAIMYFDGLINKLSHWLQSEHVTDELEVLVSAISRGLNGKGPCRKSVQKNTDMVSPVTFFVNLLQTLAI